MPALRASTICELMSKTPEEMRQIAAWLRRESIRKEAIPLTGKALASGKEHPP